MYIPPQPSPPFPPEDIRRFMPSSDERLVRDGDSLLRPLLGRFAMAGLVVDIGCGYGRLAYALDRAGFRGRYTGVDILKKPVAWLQNNFTPCRPNYEFQHFDVQNARYNPEGKLSAQDLSVPEGADLITLFSVFTHMYEHDIRTYLRLISSAAAPGALICATAFLLNEEQRAGEAEGRSAYPMLRELKSGVRYFNDVDPLHAIAYDEAMFRSWCTEVNLHTEAVLYGAWCGRRNAPTYQDTLLLRK